MTTIAPAAAVDEALRRALVDAIRDETTEEPPRRTVPAAYWADEPPRRRTRELVIVVEVGELDRPSPRRED
jgi:hypothetical protein